MVRIIYDIDFSYIYTYNTYIFQYLLAIIYVLTTIYLNTCEYFATIIKAENVKQIEKD